MSLDSEKGMPRRAAIYCRISKDREGRELGVERQEQDCRKKAASEGYAEVTVFTDNDISASTLSNKLRPEFDKMMKRVEAGEFAAIIAYSNSRLTRRVIEGQRLIDAVKRTGARIYTVVSGQHDLDTADGRGAWMTILVWDQAEAERTAERVRRSKAQAAENGIWRGGQRPYGYEADGMTLRPDEAEIVQLATRSVLAGRALRALARDLNKAGKLMLREQRLQKDNTGKPLLDEDGNQVRADEWIKWDAQKLRDILTRARNAGLIGTAPFRTGKPVQVVLDKDGEPVKAKWPAIVPEDEWRAVCAMLGDSSRRLNKSNASKYLGSSIYICGVCGGIMRPAPLVAPKKKDPFGNTVLGRDGKPVLKYPDRPPRIHYRCDTTQHLAITQEPTDLYVSEWLAELLRDPKIIAAWRNPAAGPDFSQFHRERSALESQIVELEQAWAGGSKKYDLDQITRLTRLIKEKIEDVDRRLAEATRTNLADPIMNAADPGKAFLEAQIDVQRSMLRAFVNVTIITAKEAGLDRGQGWSKKRIVFTPAEGLSSELSGLVADRALRTDSRRAQPECLSPDPGGPGPGAGVPGPAD